MELETLDNFCFQKEIQYIDVLKSDTQGYDLEVFKGAEILMEQNKIGWIYCELTFSDVYRNLPGVHEIFKFLTDRRFFFVDFYSMNYQNNLAGWADGLFVHESLIGTTLKTSAN